MRTSDCDSRGHGSRGATVPRPMHGCGARAHVAASLAQILPVVITCLRQCAQAFSVTRCPRQSAQTTSDDQTGRPVHLTVA